MNTSWLIYGHLRSFKQRLVTRSKPWSNMAFTGQTLRPQMRRSKLTPGALRSHLDFGLLGESGWSVVPQGPISPVPLPLASMLGRMPHWHVW